MASNSEKTATQKLPQKLPWSLLRAGGRFGLSDLFIPHSAIRNSLWELESGGWEQFKKR